MTYAATQQRTVERLRTFDAKASEAAIARLLRWVSHCAAVHARGDVRDCGATPTTLCAEAAREKN